MKISEEKLPSTTVNKISNGGGSTFSDKCFGCQKRPKSKNHTLSEAADIPVVKTPRTGGRESRRECRKTGRLKTWLKIRSNMECFFLLWIISLGFPKHYATVLGIQIQLKEELAALSPVPCKQIFSVKTDADGKPVRHKTRPVVKGCVERRSIGYGQTCAPVAKLDTDGLGLKSSYKDC